MKKYIEDKVFNDELELWYFLQSLKGMPLGVPDGHYCVEFAETSRGQLQFRCMLRFSDRKLLNRVLYERPMKPRFYFYVKSDETFCMGIESPHMRTHEEIKEGLWRLLNYVDILSPAEGPQMYFTDADYDAAFEALAEALIVNAKKVA